VGDVARVAVHGRTVHVVAFAPYESFHNLRDIKAARRLVSRLAAHGDPVIVSFHGGAEGIERDHVPNGPEIFLGENRGDLRLFAHEMVSAGADLVLGHGPHVVRGMEVYRGRLIAYSLGYFATYGAFDLADRAGLSLILEVRMAADGSFVDGMVYPIRQDEPGGPRLDLQREILPILRQLSAEDFGRRAVVAGDDGRLAPP
jgi:poly-gamma-glutamate capsule biosynthesis protein CapA/YwtB (metallophosphatase superfamily)